MRRVFVFMCLLLAPAFASTVISVGGDVNPAPPEGTGGPALVDFSQAWAVAWVQTGTYQDVSIRINARDYSFGLGGAVSFLTNSIGPGTSSFNEIARNDAVTADPFSDGPVLLFGGLTLEPGLYYLVLAPLLDEFGNSDTQMGWNTTDPAGEVVTTAPDVFRGDLVGAVQFYANPDAGFFEPYVPAWSFIEGAGPGGDLLFDVATPEPGTAWVVLAAGALLWWRRRRLA